MAAERSFRRRRLSGAIAPMIFLSLVAYFAWNAVQGEHGLVATEERRKLLLQAQGDQAAALAEKAAWERRVAGLRANDLDRDALDERAREMLNLSDPADIVVNYGPKNRLY
jgi:cell division protein FtsB